jgi:WhiB family redox-sensing transcriptional regulator
VYARNTEVIAYDDEWRKRAVCLGVDTNLFYPETTANGSVKASNLAKRMFCSHCPVQIECAAEAFENGEHGVWGCLSESERRKMRQAEFRTRYAATIAQLEAM